MNGLTQQPMMKIFPTILLLTFLLVGRVPAEEVYYLHCFSPTYGQKIDPQPGEEPARPPSRIISLRITPGSDFEAMFGNGSSSVSGRLTSADGSLDLKLKGSHASGFAFDGKVGLEEIFEPGVTWFVSAIFNYKCVVSRQKDIEPFLKTQAAIDAKRLEELTRTSRENQRKRREAEKSETD